MQNLLSRAHLPAVKFSPRAFMGCGGWDLAQAPPTVAASMDAMDEQIPTRASRSFSRPRRSMGCGGGGFPSMPAELVEPDEKQLSCGGGGGDPGGYMPEFMKAKEEEIARSATMGCGCSRRADEDEGEPTGPIVTLKPGLSGPRVHMGCGDEPCEECARAAAASGMGCTKCKRIRQRAMVNELDAMHQLGQASSGLPDTSVLVVSGLAVAGLFYLATR